jgi:hypothetical protein
MLVPTSQVGREALALDVRRVRRSCLQPARGLSVVWYATS